MKKFLLFAGAFVVGIGAANAAVRDASSVNRKSSSTSAQTTTTRSATATARTGNIVSRSATTTGRTATRSTTTARKARGTTPTSTTVRSAVAPTSARNARSATTGTAAASASRAARSATAARATISAASSNTFGTGYNACRDAYFTCMDQFCAKQNETYRRCVCSSRLSEIQSRERTLSQTASQLQDFKDLNIDVIPKTSGEVKAMLSATAGEAIAATAKDRSDSAQKLAGISEVLSNTKTKALSTQGTIDIAGDINSIWATTDLASGAQLANLTGEPLYNAVHSQCVDLIADKCASTATLNMVVSAYGMYIENDCTTLATALDKKVTAANATIRATESEMHAARLENYDAHNSTEINDCIAQVRRDITANTACGENYVHCLDVSGKYLNRDTGAPIYTSDFYQLASATSLSGDILTNQANRLLVSELNRKRAFAERGLDTCRDLADDVWDEFMRQAITEIYQGQQDRVRQVKDECLDVVNKCYDTKSNQLKDFSNVKEQLLLGSRLELSEELCREKLDACSNLYGGGSQGKAELVSAMKVFTDQKIAQECQTALLDYTKDICKASGNDSLHSYPYGCKAYTPGNQYNVEMCMNQSEFKALPQCPVPSWQPTTGSFVCTTTKVKQYTKCHQGYYMATSNNNNIWEYNGTPAYGNKCISCSKLFLEQGLVCKCRGGTAKPVCDPYATDCADYDNSLYKKLVRYAQQVCVRPSESNTPRLPSHILQDINVVMDSIRIDMARELSKECARLGGIWVDTARDEKPYKTASTQTAAESSSGEASDTIIDKTNSQIHVQFYIETSASTKWGYCAAAPQSQTSSDKEDE